MKITFNTYKLLFMNEFSFMRSEVQGLNLVSWV